MRSNQKMPAAAFMPAIVLALCAIFAFSGCKKECGSVIQPAQTGYLLTIPARAIAQIPQGKELKLTILVGDSKQSFAIGKAKQVSEGELLFETKDKLRYLVMEPTWRMAIAPVHVNASECWDAEHKYAICGANFRMCNSWCFEDVELGCRCIY